MPKLPDLRAGIYRHYKGQHYQVIGYGHDANAADLYVKWDGIDGRDPCLHRPVGAERFVVIYMGLELTDAHDGPRWAVRSVDDFFAWVHAEDGERCDRVGRGSTWCAYHQRTVVPRFDYVGPMWIPAPRS